MKDIKFFKGFDIVLGYACNVKCNFCFQKDYRTKFPNLSKKTVLDILDKEYLNGNRYVIFSGGEPTLDNNLLLYIKYAKKIGYQIVRVHTNGNYFNNFEFLYKLYKNGLNGVTISIHGYGRIHDRITNVSGSFKIINDALNNFERLSELDNKFIFDVNTVISKDNIGNLLNYFLYIKKFKFLRLQFVIPYTLDLFTIREKENIIPQYSSFIKELQQILYLSLKYKKKVVIENIPYCIIGIHFKWSIKDNIKLNQASYEKVNGYVESVDEENAAPMHKAKSCLKCKYNKICKGIPKEYYDIYGDISLIPIYD